MSRPLHTTAVLAGRTYWAEFCNEPCSEPGLCQANDLGSIAVRIDFHAGGARRHPGNSDAPSRSIALGDVRWT